LHRLQQFSSGKYTWRIQVSTPPLEFTVLEDFPEEMIVNITQRAVINITNPQNEGIYTSLTITISGDQARAKLKNNNQKYAPDVTLVTRITDSDGTLLTEKNTTINVPAEYSKLIEVKLSFIGSQQQYILIAFVVDPHNISSPEDTATFTPSVPVAPPPTVPTPPSPPSPPTMPTPSWFWYLVAFLSIIIVLVLAIYALMRMSRGKSVKLSDTW